MQPKDRPCGDPSQTEEDTRLQQLGLPLENGAYEHFKNGIENDRSLKKLLVSLNLQLHGVFA